MLAQLMEILSFISHDEQIYERNPSQLKHLSDGLHWVWNLREQLGLRATFSMPF